MHKACSMVPHAYGLARQLKSMSHMEKVIQWLVGDLRFLHPNINISVSVLFYTSPH